MSMRLPAGILRPGYNPLLVANAPTIGAATVASATSVSVAFTAPSCTGGSVISTYTAYCTTTGTNTATGASSPITVTGLTTGQAYTFRVIATNIYGPSYPSAVSNSATPVAQGQQEYTTAGTFTWVAPTGVTSVSIVTVGGGGPGSNNATGAGGGGGALGWKNNISVTPGTGYTVIVGAGGVRGFGGVGGTDGGPSSVLGVVAGGGIRGGPSCGGFRPGGAGGTTTGATGGQPGGAGGNYSTSWGAAGAATTTAGGVGGQGFNGGAGGGGAGGYASGTASGGGGGAAFRPGCLMGSGAGGGGVGIYGQGSPGAAGSASINGAPTGGGGGSGGAAGTNGSITGSYPGGPGGLYGGGGGGAGFFLNCPCVGNISASGNGAGGAVRIIWPGTTRSFPSTNTGNL